MEKNNIIIKKANINNIEDILEIEHSVGQNMFSKINLEEDLKNEFFNYFISYINLIPVGFIGIKTVFDSIDLEYIAVLNEYQNLGVGTKLFYYVLEYAKKHNIKNILLEVRKSNLKAINFYEKMGFIKLSERKKYYNDNEDAYILEYKL